MDQDKPRPARPSPSDAGQRFPFSFDWRMRAVARLVGVTPDRSGVELDDEHLTVRFGRWTLRSDLENISAVELTGPYAWWKVAGPPRLSLADRGITFATTTARGVCISFHTPVPAAFPISAIRHPAATVTVADPEGLAAAIEAATGATRT